MTLGSNPSTGTDSSNPGAEASCRPTTEDRLPPGSFVLLSAMLAAAFVMMLNESILTTGLPQVMRDLHVGASTAQWLTTGFTLVMAIVTPSTAFVLQRFRTRAVFLAAVGSFVAGTALGVLAPGFAVLMIARVVQACGTAVMLPLVMTTIMQLVPASRRGRYMGLVTVVMGVAPAVGPTLSGVIVDEFGWRGIFVVLLPIAVAALILGAAKLMDLHTPSPVHLDGWSILWGAFAFGGLIYGISALGEGHAALPPWIPVLVGAATLAVSVLRQVHRQREGRTPLLDLRPFSTPAFALAVGILLIGILAQAGTMILLPLYSQNAVGLSVRAAGLVMLPGGLLMALLSPLAGSTTVSARTPCSCPEASRSAAPCGPSERCSTPTLLSRGSPHCTGCSTSASHS